MTVPHPAVPAVDIRDLHKTYGSTRAVDGLSLSVRPATICALLGRNGAGKSTTIECLLGFRRPDAGHLRVLGLDPVAERAAVTARIGVMLQEGGAWQAATAAEMLRLYAALYAEPLTVDGLLERLGLTAVAGQRYRTLSGGQKQRLHLALALIGRPDLLVLDEPTAGMDVHARHDTWALLDELRADGATVLLCTHLVEEAEQLTDHVAVIDAGSVIAEGSPGEVARRHGSDEVRLVTSSEVDVEALVTDTGVAATRIGPGRYRLAAGPHVIPAVTAWCTRHAIDVTSVDGGGGLEAAFLALTGGAAREQR